MDKKGRPTEKIPSLVFLPLCMSMCVNTRKCTHARAHAHTVVGVIKDFKLDKNEMTKVNYNKSRNDTGIINRERLEKLPCVSIQTLIEEKAKVVIQNIS